MPVQRRATKQRSMIYSYVIGCGYHPSAEDVYKYLVKDLPELSLGTVYRNLNLLVEMGELGQISLAGFSDKFDFKTTKHSHFMCRKCGNVYDIENNFGVEFEEQYKAYKDFSIDDYDLTFKGVCLSCK
ncbi:MAG: Fur family transcriptional regulator [Oscillospiraceae bacterium]